MRPYRGKTKDGKWVYGSLSMGGYQPYDENATFIEPNEPVLRRIPVIPSTVGQSTGLKDKNGVEIFEGDILRYDSSRVWKVEFYNGGWQINEMPWDEENEPANRYELYGWDIPCEVIGNVHDNSELLEAE